jgi:son of sevenless-like protein
VLAPVVEKVFARVAKDVLPDKSVRLEFSAIVYLMAVLDYVAADTLKLAGNYVDHCQSYVIKEADLRVAIGADAVLTQLYEPLSHPSTSVG